MKECILNSAPKSYELDPIPPKLLIECLYSIIPSLSDQFNSSLASCIFPQCFKSALVTPILKKRCLDLNDLNNYRPVSNLCFIAKILGKLVLSQVSSYLNSQNLNNTCQSACRPGHSTETALLKVVNDLFLSPNKGIIFVLALIDFSSAFDTIDHPTLVHRLHTDFGFTDTVLQWLWTIGVVVRMSILDTKGWRFEPQHQYIFSLSKRLYPHCFSRLSCEMSTRWGQPREGCSVLWALRRNST